MLPAPSGIALSAAVLSIVTKEWLFRYTIVYARGGLRSDALTANAWHHRSDALSSIGTMIGIGGAVLLGGRWAVLDPPIAAVILSFLYSEWQSRSRIRISTNCWKPLWILQLTKVLRKSSYPQKEYWVSMS